MKTIALLLALAAGRASAWNGTIPLTATATAAAGTAVTVTLPAGGTNMYHLITRIEIRAYSTAAITASATPIKVTTTNLMGMEWLLANVASGAAILQQQPTEPNYTPGLMCAAANTASTIVCPATASIIWDVCVWYSTPSMPQAW